MGDLFAATDRASGESVVVKVLRPELAAQPDAHERMRVEGEAIWQLSHPHIVAGRGQGLTSDGRPYVAMERLRGRTLRAEARLRGPLPAPEAIRHTRQLLSALRAVHAAGVVHRDVKPDNVMLCETSARGEPRIKLIDFGIAKVIRRQPIGGAGSALPPGPGREVRIAPMAIPTLDGICVGTPRYVSPEQASGAAIDPRSDVYAAGILLYTLVAGRGPFDEIRDVAALLEAHRDLAPPPPSSVARVPIPPLLEGVILQAIAKDPADRFASALAFSHALWRTVSRMSSPIAVAAALPAPRLVERPVLVPAPPPARRPDGGPVRLPEVAAQGHRDLAHLRAEPIGPVSPRARRAPRAPSGASNVGGHAQASAMRPPGPHLSPRPPRRPRPPGMLATTGRRRRARCRRRPRHRWMCDAGLVLGAAAFAAAAGAVSMWLIS
jgi:serine/threonine-protein kinase